MRRAGILGALLAVLVGGMVAFYLNEAGKPGEAVTQQPSPHIKNAGDPHAAYNSDPPTSGPHLPETAPWGVSTTPVPKESVVHNLEDGGVVINYRPDLDQATVDRLAELTSGYNSDVLMAPYPGLSSAIVLTAWGRIDRMAAYDEARLKRFIEAFRGRDHHRDSGT